MREGSAPNFCPPVEEGTVYAFEDEEGVVTNLEFLGLIIYEERSFGFFLPLEEEEGEAEFGELIVLEVIAVDEEGQPEEFEMVEDEELILGVYEAFKEATKDLYEFE